ncbi:MAG: anthranilate synthase component I family protein [Pyrinomonadaceae bacterium]
MTTIEQFLQKAALANVVPVTTTVSADLLTPLGVYLKLSKASPNAFLLESVEGGESLARYSFIGADPKMIARGSDQRVTLTTGEGEHTVDTSVIELLRKHFAEHMAIEDPDLPTFIGGAIGYLGYDCSEWFEPVLRSGDKVETQKDDSVLFFFRSVVAFDHAKQIIEIVSLVLTEEAFGDQNRLEHLFADAVKTNQSIASILENDSIKLPARSNGINGPVASNWNRNDFEDAVRTVKQLIDAGECYQVVLSQCFSKPTSATDVAIYRAVRSLNPSPYMFLLRNGERSIIGASPEMLVRCRASMLEYRPIAGTRPRGESAAADQLLAGEMLADTKEISEHMMLVDLGRNDLGRVAEFGSVDVLELMSVEKYSHVQHMVTSLSARLRPGLDRFDAIASCFPAGTVTGAPKVRAMQIIRDLEPTTRGVYAGAVGYFDYSGNMDTCIAIRTLVLEKGVAHVHAGAGIVADSVPSLEYEETVNKAAALLKAVEIAEAIVG